MIEYAIFCIATCITALIRCHIPVWRALAGHRNPYIHGAFFWPGVVLSMLVFAPVVFLATVFYPERYKDLIAERLLAHG